MGKGEEYRYIGWKVRLSTHWLSVLREKILTNLKGPRINGEFSCGSGEKCGGQQGHR
jgi:hypothetical protein